MVRIVSTESELPCWKNHEEPNDVEVWGLVGEHDQASRDGQHDKYEGPVLENNIFKYWNF